MSLRLSIRVFPNSFISFNHNLILEVNLFTNAYIRSQSSETYLLFNLFWVSMGGTELLASRGPDV